MNEVSKPARRRWAVLGLLFASTILNYVDRQTLSILAAHIQLDLNTVSYTHLTLPTNREV